MKVIYSNGVTYNIKYMLFRALKAMKLLPDDLIQTSQLDFKNKNTLAKQLDEYRELIETIEEETGYFSSPRGRFLSQIHAAHLDNYLVWLFSLKYGDIPRNKASYEFDPTSHHHIRLRPEVLHDAPEK